MPLSCMARALFRYSYFFLWCLVVVIIFHDCILSIFCVLSLSLSLCQSFNGSLVLPHSHILTDCGLFVYFFPAISFFCAMCNMDLFILLTSKQHRKLVTTRASSSKSFAQTSFSCSVAAAATDGFYRFLALQFSLFSDCIRFVLSTLNAYMRAYYYTTAPKLLILSSYMHSITYTHAQTMD